MRGGGGGGTFIMEIEGENRSILGIGLGGLVCIVLYLSLPPNAPIITLLTISILGLSLFKPEFGLIVFVLLSPFPAITTEVLNIGGGLNLQTAFMIFIFAGWMVKSLIRKEKFFEKTSINIPLLLFIVWSFLSLIRGSFYLGSGVRDYNLNIWKRVIFSRLLFFYAVNIIKDRKTVILFVISMILTTPYIAHAVLDQYEAVKGIADVGFVKNQIGGSFAKGMSNEIGLFLGQAAVLAIGLSMRIPSFWKKFLFAAIAGFDIYGLFFTFSRASYGALLFSVIFLTLVKKKKMLILVILMFFVSQMIMPSVVTERTGQMGSDSWHERTELWKESIIRTLHHPFLGVGFGSSVHLGSRMFPHNQYLLIAEEMGVVGIGLFLLIIYFCLRDEWNLLKIAKDRWTEGVLLGIFGYTVFLLAGQFFGQSLRYFPFSVYFWVLTGLAMRLNLLEKHKMEEGRLG